MVVSIRKYPDSLPIKDVKMNRPFIGERYWEDKKNYKIINITHIGMNLIVDVKLEK